VNPSPLSTASRTCKRPTSFNNFQDQKKSDHHCPDVRKLWIQKKKKGKRREIIPRPCIVGTRDQVCPLLQVCFSTVHQLSLTEIITTVCCDRVYRIISADLRTVQTTGIDLSDTIYDDGKTGQDAINDQFGLLPYTGETYPGPCSNWTACLGRSSMQRTIIDRMPPVLMVVHIGEVGSESQINMLAPKTIR
jgi:hypothetical protein